MNTPYTPPEAPLAQEPEKYTPYKNSFSRNAWVAITIYSALFFMLTALSFYSTPTSIIHELVKLIFMSSYIILIIYFIKRFRVKNLGQSNEVHIKELGVWGYCWRGFITLIASVVTQILLILAIMTPLLMSSLKPALLTYIREMSEYTGALIYGALTYPVIPLVVWALFSKDRSGQFKKLTAIFRSRHSK